MTSLVSWVGVDQRQPSSIYIATDSRVSWGPQYVWDFGRKVFASRTQPEVLAYVGDVFFPSLILGQIVNIIDDGPEIGNEGIPESRFEWIESMVRESFEQFPSRAQNSFRIAYATRTGEKMGSEFHFFWLKWNHDGWSSGQRKIPITSDTVVIWGSGSSFISRWKQRWDSSSQRQTSRAIFSALCDSLDDGCDPYSGGAPQLVGIYRIGTARTIGIIHQELPYIFGLPVTPSEHSDETIEWRNRWFERCNRQGEKLPSAQKHHVPQGLGGIRKW